VDVCVGRDSPLYRLGQREEFALKFVQPERKTTARLHFITQPGKLIVVTVEEVLVDEILDLGRQLAITTANLR
jgi:hypothetical protein